MEPAPTNRIDASRHEDPCGFVHVSLVDSYFTRSKERRGRLQTVFCSSSSHHRFGLEINHDPFVLTELD